MLTKLLAVLVVTNVVTGIDLPPAEDEEVRSAVVLNQLILQQQFVVLQEMERSMKNVEQHLKADSSCPYPYVQVLDECFYLSDSKLPWSAARYYCQGMKGDLATPKNLYALKSYILKNTIDGNAVFVGGTDEEEEGVWKWLDGRLVTMAEFPGIQPDNHEGGENCMEIRTLWHPTLNDEKCTTHRHFVCQYKPN